MKANIRSIFVFTCPKCKTKLRFFPHSLKEWRSGDRRCSSCGAWIFLSNFLISFLGIYVLILIGLWTVVKHLLFLTFSLHTGDYRTRAMLILVVLIIGIMMPIIPTIFPKRRVVKNKLKDSVEIRKINQKWCNIFAIGSLALGIINFLLVSASIVAFFGMIDNSPTGFHFLLLLNLTLSWSWPIVLGIIALKMMAKDKGKTQVRKPAVFGIALGIISGIAEIVMFFGYLWKLKFTGFSI